MEAVTEERMRQKLKAITKPAPLHAEPMLLRSHVWPQAHPGMCLKALWGFSLAKSHQTAQHHISQYLPPPLTALSRSYCRLYPVNTWSWHMNSRIHIVVFLLLLPRLHTTDHRCCTYLYCYMYNEDKNLLVARAAASVTNPA